MDQRIKIDPPQLIFSKASIKEDDGIIRSTAALTISNLSSSSTKKDNDKAAVAGKKIVKCSFFSFEKTDPEKTLAMEVSPSECIIAPHEKKCITFQLLFNGKIENSVTSTNLNSVVVVMALSSSSDDEDEGKGNLLQQQRPTRGEVVVAQQRGEFFVWELIRIPCVLDFLVPANPQPEAKITTTQQSDNDDDIESLPAEVISDVFQHITIQEMCRAREISTKLQESIDFWHAEEMSEVVRRSVVVVDPPHNLVCVSRIFPPPHFQKNEKQFLHFLEVTQTGPYLLRAILFAGKSFYFTCVKENIVNYLLQPKIIDAIDSSFFRPQINSLRFTGVPGKSIESLLLYLQQLHKMDPINIQPLQSLTVTGDKKFCNDDLCRIAPLINPYLQSLKIYACPEMDDGVQNTPESLVNILCTFTQLQSLELSSLPKFWGATMTKQNEEIGNRYYSRISHQPTLEFLKGMPHLKNLILTGNANLLTFYHTMTGTVFTPLREVASTLTRLNLSDSGVVESTFVEALPYLVNLEQLELRAVHMTLHGISCFSKQLKQLHHLNMEGMHCLQPISMLVGKISENCKELRYLNIGNCGNVSQLEAVISSGFCAKMPLLETLILKLEGSSYRVLGTKLQPTDWEPLTDCSMLTFLDLSGWQLGHDGTKGIDALKEHFSSRGSTLRVKL